LRCGGEPTSNEVYRTLSWPARRGEARAWTELSQRRDPRVPRLRPLPLSPDYNRRPLRARTLNVKKSDAANTRVPPSRHSSSA